MPNTKKVRIWVVKDAWMEVLAVYPHKDKEMAQFVAANIKGASLWPETMIVDGE